ncbi:THO2 plays a role in transcriptional elongation [Elasticomyces elasticus]|nr:THO2 plays a role in transcriptional elongation [Elasticomyces elasticus]
MAPGGVGGKRKRGDRQFSQDDGTRQSPHRPENLHLSQQNAYQNQQQQYNYVQAHGRGPGGNNQGQHSQGMGQGQNQGQRGGQRRGRGGQGHPGHPGYQGHLGHQGYQGHPGQQAQQGYQGYQGYQAHQGYQALASSPTTTASAGMRPPQPQGAAQLPSEPPAPFQNRPPPPVLSGGTPSPHPSPMAPVQSIDTSPVVAKSNYFYEYLTDESVSSWNTTGREALLQLARDAQARTDMIDLAVLMQELVQTALEVRLSAQEIGSFIRDLHSDGRDTLVPSLLSSTLSLLEPLPSVSTILRELLSAARLDPDHLRSDLDLSLLTSLGLVRDTFERMRTRRTTTLLYKQCSYNLLREQSEGYSKLVTEVFNTAFSNTSQSLPDATEAFERVKAIIGAFDLDVGRVLDVTLDVMANMLIRSHRFFVRFLRASSWWPEDHVPDFIQYSEWGPGSLPAWAFPGAGPPRNRKEEERTSTSKNQTEAEFWSNSREHGVKSFFFLGARRISNFDHIRGTLEIEEPPELDTKGKVANSSKSFRLNQSRKHMLETRTLPPLGNPDAAQLLGFKLRFYASAARDKTDELPDNLIWLSALLIKIGFISLRDLWPHLYPPDDQMEDVKNKVMKMREEEERRNRPGGGVNALALAGALADDTMPAPSMSRVRELATTTATAGRNTPAAGASPRPDSGSTSTNAADKAGTEDSKEKTELPEPDNQKILLLKNLLAIGAVPEALFILGRFPWMLDAYPDLAPYLHRIAHRMIERVYAAAKPLAERQGVTMAKKPFSPDTGSKAVQTPQKRSLKWAQLDQEDTGDGISYRFYYEDWDSNIPLARTAADVLLLCDTFVNLSGVRIGLDPSLLTKLIRIGKHALAHDPSEENTGRWVDLAKRLLVPALTLTDRNPGVVKELWSLIEHLPTQTRFNIYSEWYWGPTSRSPVLKTAFDRIRAQTKDCLKRISKTNFKLMGKQLAKIAYSAPGIVMTEAIRQMESYENLIEVVVECTKFFTYLGYDVLTYTLLTALGNTNNSRQRLQGDGMLTSPWLRALASFAGAIYKRYSIALPSPILQYVAAELRKGNSTDLEILEQICVSMTGVKSDIIFNDAQVLAMAGGEVLQSQTLIGLADERHTARSSSRRFVRALADTGLTGQLLVSIAQELQMYCHRDVAKGAPLKVLGTNLDKIHAVLMQYLDVLRTNLSVKDFDEKVPNLCDLIGNFGLEPAVAFTIARKSIRNQITEADALIKAEKERRLSLDKQTNGDVDMADGDAKHVIQRTITDATPPEDSESKLDTVRSPSSTLPAPVNGLHPALAPLLDRLKPALSQELQTAISIPFYITFWSLSLQDILYEPKSYELERDRQRDAIVKINSDRSDLTSKGMKEKEKSKRAIAAIQEKLLKESSKALESYIKARAQLNKQKDHWFSTIQMSKKDVESMHVVLLQECFLPRLLLGPLDAMYTFLFIKFLHSNGALGFRTMHLYDRILKKNQLVSLLFSCTARESENFGRFLHELLKDLAGWHSDRATYEKLAFGSRKNLPGFAKRYSAERGANEFLDYEDFRRLLWKWHGNLNAAFKACFESEEYMCIRNAIVVLKFVHAWFPTINFMGNSMLAAVVKLSQEEKRSDLKLAAMSLIGDLKKREKSWIMPQAFRIPAGTEIASSPASRAPSTRPDTPKPGRSAEGGTYQSLDAKAAPFRPAIKGVDRKVSMAEDGEIEDVKMVDAVESPVREPSSFTGPVSSIHESVDAREELKKAKSIPATMISVHDTVDPALQRVGSTASLQSQHLSTPTQQPLNAHQPDMGRPASHASVSRQPHSLPVRPDLSTRSVSSRPEEGYTSRPQPRHDGRGRGPEDLVRSERADVMRTFNETHRESSPVSRSRPRTPEAHQDQARHPPNPSSRYSRPEDRFPRPLPQDIRHGDRSVDSGSQQAQRAQTRPPLDARDRMRQALLPPPTAGPLPRPDRSGFVIPGRTNLVGRQPDKVPPGTALITQTPQTDERGGVNPARLALINGDQAIDRGDRHREPSRHSREDGRHGGSRPQSPRRLEGPQQHSNISTRMESDASDRRANFEPATAPSQTTSSRDRRDDTAQHPLNSARTGRNDRSEPHGKPGSRELFDSAPQPRQPVELSHGRLSQDFGPRRQQQESSFGRLNTGPDVPSGPRGTSGPSQRGGRNFSASQVQNRNTSIDANAPGSSIPPSASRGPPQRVPTGHQNQPPIQQEWRPFPHSQPTTPAVENAPTVETVGIHPSRLAQLQPPPIQTNSAVSANASRQLPSPSSTAQPSGSQHQAPIGAPTGPGSSHTARGPPSAPSSAVDRSSNRRALANINETLQGSERGTSIRGRASRQNSTMVPPPMQQAQAPLQIASRIDINNNRDQGLPIMPEQHGRQALISCLRTEAARTVQLLDATMGSASRVGTARAEITAETVARRMSNSVLMSRITTDKEARCLTKFTTRDLTDPGQTLVPEAVAEHMKTTTEISRNAVDEVETTEWAVG